MLTVDKEKTLSTEESGTNESEANIEVSENLKNINSLFSQLTISELEDAILVTLDRNEKILYRTMLNLKMQLDQEKIINQTLL